MFFKACHPVLLRVQSYLATSVRYKRRMSSPVGPPHAVRGMKEWNPEAFRTKSTLPCLSIKADRISSLKKFLEKYTAKINSFKSIQDTDLENRKILVLNPKLVKTFSDLQDIHDALQENLVCEDDYMTKEFEFVSDNWKPHEKLKYILPEGEEGVSGFSVIGHIIHLNLKENLLPYKHVIGEVLLETKNIRTVVTKTSNIDNTFRNFELEVLAGEKDFEVSVKENGVTFSFDFSKVYWNPRLSTEHERIVKRLNKNCLLFDACAGVGPFSIPASKKCRVFANDLNPESCKWLNYNIAKNRPRTEWIRSYNLDAREFIKDVMVPQLKQLMETKSEDETGEEIKEIHITMNLPALAVTFLDVFQGLLADYPSLNTPDLLLPIVHVYTFSKAEDTFTEVRERVELYLGTKLDTDHLIEVAFVRNVAPNKDMLRATFKVPRQIMFEAPKKRKNDEDISPMKKAKE